MSTPKTRREFWVDAAWITAPALVGSYAIAAVHAGGGDTIQIALV